MLPRPLVRVCVVLRPLKADFATGGASRVGRGGKRLTVHFASSSCNLTGLQPRPAPGAPVGKVLSKFVSGKYIIEPTGS